MLIDMICTIEPWPMADPEVIGFAHTPPVVADGTAMIYARMTEEHANAWRSLSGVDVLAEAPYTGADTPDEVYAVLFADAGASEIYHEIYDRAPLTDEDGVEHAPPERIGQMG